MPRKKFTPISPDVLRATCPGGLPIASLWDEIATSINQNQVIVVTGETGCGKTTQLPKIAIAAGQGDNARIVCTQPRRVAAVSIARRVSEEMSPIGANLVGCKIRFRDTTSPQTRIKFVTDGILLAELQGDDRLRQYDTVIVDEAHERSLNIDIILGMAKRLLASRPELRLIVTSATIDAKGFSSAFGGAPVLEIPGRSYPVDVAYWPCEDMGEASCVDKVVYAAGRLMDEGLRGGLLVFLPTEKDIRDTVRLLRANLGERAQVLPMFGRLSSSDQSRIFRPSSVPKIVIATNIAETSITVPGIRYVIDAGLARISRYNPRSRTRSLPVAPISRSSAEQRAGRAGRIEAGVCIRLYSLEEYEAMAEHSTPEINRSNLAEVILRLLAMGIRDIAGFPFIDPPHQRNVNEAFSLLRELGAIDESQRLTEDGRLMAKLPLDPRISRMILQAKREDCLREILIIASALSIQDPRERPYEKAARADQAHAVFRDERSDFVSYLKIWEAVDRLKKKKVSRGVIKRFCAEHFLSFPRMEEWRDVYDQILSALADAGGFALSAAAASYDAIHRSILAGFLGNIAVHKEERLYRAAKGREVSIFPGSGLCKRHPKWIVSFEQLKTSQLFARTIAETKPEWIEEFAGGLAVSRYFEPHWEKGRGEVMAWEQVSVFGLTVIERRKVGYARIAPDEARDIFMKQALFEGDFKGSYRFVRHNKKVLEDVREIAHRTRKNELVVQDYIILQMFEAGLKALEEVFGRNILDERSLARAINISGTDRCLCLDRDKVVAGLDTSEINLFPGHITVDGREYPLVYLFSPGDGRDGVTVRIAYGALEDLPEWPFEWLVHGMLEEKILFLLRALPKQARRALVPLPQASERLVSALMDIDNKGKGLLPALEDAIMEEYGVAIEREMWPSQSSIPPHLLMRFEVLDPTGRVAASGRDLKEIKDTLLKQRRKMLASDESWGWLRAQWERDGLEPGDLYRLPPVVSVRSKAGLTSVEGYTGLVLQGEKAGIRLFSSRAEAVSNTRAATFELLCRNISKELDYIKRRCIPASAPSEAVLRLGGAEKLKWSIFEWLKRELIEPFDGIPDKTEFQERASRFRRTVYQDALSLTELLFSILSGYADAVRALEAQPKLAAFSALRLDLEDELHRLVPAGFPSSTKRSRLAELPRYLKAFCIRAQRAYLNPMKDKEKEARITPYTKALDVWTAKIHNWGSKGGEGPRAAIEELSSLLEEYRVSVFAPEVGTSRPVSSKRLDEYLARLAKAL